MKAKTFLIIQWIVLSILITTQILILMSVNCDCNTYAMKFNKTVNKNTVLNGVYHHEGYFCVWTKDREPDEIAQTTFHELAHYYVHTQEEHFVGGKK